MAQDWYIGIGGKARRVVAAYVGVGGKARQITSGYFGVGGKAKQFWSDGGILAFDKESGSVPSMRYTMEVPLDDHLIMYIPSDPDNDRSVLYDLAIAYDKNFIVNQNITTIQTGGKYTSYENSVGTRIGNYATAMPILRNYLDYSTSYIRAFRDDTLALTSITSITRKEGSAAYIGNYGYYAFGSERTTSSNYDQMDTITPISKDLVIGNVIDSTVSARINAAAVSTDKYAMFICGQSGRSSGTRDVVCIDANGTIKALTDTGTSSLDQPMAMTRDRKTVYYANGGAGTHNTYTINENLVITNLGTSYKLYPQNQSSPNHSIEFSTRYYSSGSGSYFYVVGVKGIDKNQVETDEILFPGSIRGNPYHISYWNKRFMCLTSRSYQWNQNGNGNQTYGNAVMFLVKG